MEPRYRLELLNAGLAQALRERGLVSAPSGTVGCAPAQSRAAPSASVGFRGLRVAIEGEIDRPGAEEKVLASAARRIEQGLAHVAVAAVYPRGLRAVGSAEALRDELRFAVVTECGPSGFRSGTIEDIGAALRSALDMLARDDAVGRAARIIDDAVTDFARRAAAEAAVAERIAEALDLPGGRGGARPGRPARAGPAAARRTDYERRLAVARVGGLVLLSDMILGELDGRAGVPASGPARAVALAVASGRSTDLAVGRLAQAAREIAQMRVALRHDLMGRVYHKLLADRKYLATYFTSIPAAVLLLKLALRPEAWAVDWGDLEAVGRLRLADLACGTGTLLMAAADALLDNYVSARVAAGEGAECDKLHAVLAEETLRGYDVLGSAIHLAASALAVRAPHVPRGKMHVYALPLGGEESRLGSIEFLARPGAEAGGSPVAGGPEPPPLDLCAMNPPFARSVGGNLLFGSAGRGSPTRRRMQGRLAGIIESSGVMASSTAGLGAVFVAAADRYVKPGGRLAVVLPKAVLSGVAWSKTRELLRERYRVEFIVVSHEPGRWGFSESTSLSEVLLVAVKKGSDEAAREPAHDGGRRTGEPSEAPPQDHDGAERTVAVNLWRNPRTCFEAREVAYDVLTRPAPDLAEGQKAAEGESGGAKFAETVSVPWGWLRVRESWLAPCAFAQSELSRAALALETGELRLPGGASSVRLALCPLGELGRLGPDVRDVQDGFGASVRPTSYPAFSGHDSGRVASLYQEPNSFLAPLRRARRGRPLRRAADLWPLAGNVLIAERLWLNTHRVSAVRTPGRVLSRSSWWPLRLGRGAPGASAQKALVVWLNSTLGLLLLIAARVETRGAWVKFKKPALERMPVLDPRRLGRGQLEGLACAFDRARRMRFEPFPQMAADEARASLDRAVSAALGLGELAPLRRALAREPVVSLEALGT